MEMESSVAVDEEKLNKVIEDAAHAVSSVDMLFRAFCAIHGQLKNLVELVESGSLSEVYRAAQDARIELKSAEQRVFWRFCKSGD